MLRPCLAAVLVSATTLATSHAVIVAGGDGTQNTTAPTGAGNDFGFANVGQVFDTADGIYIGGVYLGNGWVISAYHGVRNGSGGYLFGNVLLAGSAFTVDASSVVRLSASANTADLVVFRLAGSSFPSLPSVTLSASTPSVNSALAMAGNGLNRASSQTQWDINTSTNPDTWTETLASGSAQGYYWAGGATLRWGNNKRSNAGVAPLNDGYGLTSVFQTTFSNDGSALTDEAQAAPGDSGGGVFYKNGSTWELSGIMLAIGHDTSSFDGQPSNAAIFTDITYIADIKTYRTQILSIIPEPSSALLLGVAGGALVVRRRRHHESRR